MPCKNINKRNRIKRKRFASERKTDSRGAGSSVCYGTQPAASCLLCVIYYFFFAKAQTQRVSFIRDSFQRSCSFSHFSLSLNLPVLCFRNASLMAVVACAVLHQLIVHDHHG